MAVVEAVEEIVAIVEEEAAPEPGEAHLTKIILRLIQTSLKINKFKLVKNLTKGVPKQVRMSQLMPVLAIGRKAAKLHTVVTPWSAAGPTS